MAPSDRNSERSRSGSDESDTDILFLQIDHDEPFPFLLNGICDSYYSTLTVPSLFQGSNQQIFREQRRYDHADIPVIGMASPVDMVYAVDDEYSEDGERGSPLMTSSTPRKSEGSPRNVLDNALFDGQLLDCPLVESEGKGYQLIFLNRRGC